MKSRLLLGILLAAAGCKDKAQPSVGSGTGSGSSGSAVTKDDPQAIMLPRLTGKAPKKTAKPFTKADFETLAKIQLKSFSHEVRTLSERSLNVKHKVTVRPMIETTVTITPCIKCIPMDVEQWRADKQNLMNTSLAKDLQDAKDTIFEVGEATLGGQKLILGGQKLIYQYQLGWNLGRTDSGISGSYTHMYMLFFNDGQNEIRVRTNYADDPPASLQAVKTMTPRDQLEAIATAFVDVYTQAWAP
jgi:hypothetical protein